jgi:hypothetical protein
MQDCINLLATLLRLDTLGSMKTLCQAAWNTLGLSLMLTSVFGRPAKADQPEPDYLLDVRPILADNCFRCHGGDEQSREAGLRLDLRETAVRGGDSGDPAIVPGKPDASS